jgi:hypothetical protein
MTDSMATESTEKHGKNQHSVEFFRVLPWIPWLKKQCWHSA